MVRPAHRNDDTRTPLRVKSVVGLLPLAAATVVPNSVVAALANFAGRFAWFRTHKPQYSDYITNVFALLSGSVGLDSDQQVVGISAAGSYTNAGFTVATATHPDGTPTIGQLTLGLGLPNGAQVVIYRGLVRQVIAPATTNGILNLQIKTLDCMWLGGNATAGVAETSVVTASVMAINN